MSDLFGAQANASDYDANQIEVLEGWSLSATVRECIEPPGERALHHLVAEILDNSMDEAVAGHASWIEIYLEDHNCLSIKDNGRGIPTDPHPKFPDKSALEVILATLHAGGHFRARPSDLRWSAWCGCICGKRPVLTS